MRHYTVSIIVGIALTLPVLADAPWTPNVRVSTDVPWDFLNQGESCFGINGDTIVSVCNTAERSYIPIAPYSYSFDNGVTWTQIPFTDSMVGITWHTDPVLDVDDSGYVHMIIQFSLYQLNHYLSKDGGQTWCDTTVISTTYGIDKPWMVVHNNEIYITYQQAYGAAGIMFAKSTDYGATFSLERIWLRTGITALCMDEAENLHLALVSGGYNSLYYTKSTDKGITWSPEVYLSNVLYDTCYGDRAPINSIDACGDVVFVTWVDIRNGNLDVMGIRSADGGTTWGSSFEVNDLMAGAQCKGWVLFDDYGGLHVTWYHTPDWPTSYSSLFSFHYQYSPDSGLTFNTSMRISDTASVSYASFIGEYHITRCDDEYLYAIWADGRNGDDNDLYFSKALLSDLSTAEYHEQPIVQHMLTCPTIWRGVVALSVAQVPGHVDITVYDAAGRQVQDIYSGTISQASRLHINVNQLPQGVLFVRLSGDRMNEVRKVINIY